MNRRVKGTINATGLGAGIGAGADIASIPADTVGHALVQNVYGIGAPEAIPTAIHHAGMFPAGTLTGAAVLGGAVGLAHILGRQWPKKKK